LSGRRFSVNDLPNYSPWPARIVGLEPWAPATKSDSEVLREFEVQKWGSLLERALDLGEGLSLAALEATRNEPDLDTLVWRAEALQMARPSAVQIETVRLLAKTLASHGPIQTLVDMGAGYGGTLFPLLQQLCGRRIDCPPERVVAGELTRSGRDLLRRLAAAEDVNVKVLECDLASDDVMEPPPAGATILTSHSMMYLQSTQACLDRIVSWRPRLVLHFEPLIEHAPSTTMLGLLQRRYIDMNGYNRDLLTSLRRLATERSIELVEERAHVLGINPLLPASIVVWRPIASV
jgi:hypothetical protein